MRIRSAIGIFSISASLLSCEPPVTFTEPQPVSTANLSKFPKRIQGQYISLTDNSKLSVSNRFIQRIYDFNYTLKPADIDSTSRLSGDTLINLRTNEKLIVTHDGDSLVVHLHYVDTLFQINDDNVLRKLKGYYFLNIRYNKTSWEVKKIRLKNGQLTISGISSKTDIDNLREIMELPADTIQPFILAPTKRQLKKFVKNDGFSDSEVFIKQR